jgi:hypothetical protein
VGMEIWAPPHATGFFLMCALDQLKHKEDQHCSKTVAHDNGGLLQHVLMYGLEYANEIKNRM